jgi:peptide/nickel transport system permease protein
MQRYIARRLLLMIPTLLGVTFVVFIMIRSIPGDVVDLIAGDFGAADPEVKQALREEYQLDDNVAVQYVRWVGDIVTFDFGRSIISARTVNEELSNKLPITFELGILAIFFSLLIAVPVGILSAIRQDTIADYVGRSFAIGLLAVPGFWIALVAISFASLHFKWAVPPKEYIAFSENPIGNLKMMWFPRCCSAPASGSVMRSLVPPCSRSCAGLHSHRLAKGLRERVIVVRHAMRNAIIPVVTVVGLQLPVLVGGTVIIETIYSIPGMGRYYISAVQQHDYPVIQAINVLVACVVVFANLGVDLLYSVLDPRIRYS